MSFMGLEGGFPETVSPFYPNEFNPQLTLLIKLSDGADPGKWEAVEDFHSSFGWVFRNYPNKKFQIVPFAIAPEGGVKAYLMVEQVKMIPDSKAEQ